MHTAYGSIIHLVAALCQPLIATRDGNIMVSGFLEATLPTELPTGCAMHFLRYTGDLPYLTTDQMIEVDRAMIEDFGIQLMQMMENAGRTLAYLARARFLEGDPRGKQVIVLAGTGGNGGGALVCARHLHNYGAVVHVVVTAPDERFKAVPAQQLGILRRIGLPVVGPEEVAGLVARDLVVDGLIGYSLRGAPRGAAASLIRWANGQKAPILALDTPSGLDTTTGVAHDPSVRAAATMTLALPKAGLRAPRASAHVGQLYLADIGVPPELYAAPGLGLLASGGRIG
jgi:NAD(P)H-hydrate epimerase